MWLIIRKNTSAEIARIYKLILDIITACRYNSIQRCRVL